MCHGEIVSYTEYFRVPSASTAADLLVYMQMLTDYVNVSNATLANVSATAGRTLEFLEHRRSYFGVPTHPSPPTPPPHLGNAHTDPAFFEEDGVRIDLPKVARDNALKVGYFVAGKMRGDPEAMPDDHWSRAACAHEDAVLVKMHLRLLLQSADARLDFLARVYGATFDAAFKRFGVRACFTEQTENVRLECDPAPSPPPPDDWQRPPSPPAFVYEAITLASATGSSALFFAISAVCCFGVVGKAARARHNSRMWGTKDQRVDNVRWQGRTENIHDGPFGPDYTQPAAKLATGFSFKGMVTPLRTVYTQPVAKLATGFSFKGMVTRYNSVQQ